MYFVSELRRRQVFRAAAWYGAAAWLSVEIADTVFPRFGLPEWSVRVVIVIAILGLPVAVLLAWWFDLTSAGWKREQPVTEAVAEKHRVRLWRMPALWIALAVGIGLALSAQQAWLRLVRPAFNERPALAILPFANLSPDPANSYFADGLHEEILATLARAGGLRVISRTSVQQYRDTHRNLREIADALGVSLIVEGSVRRAGDDVRLTLQLIDARNDEHLWAQTYDRKFSDSLDLQRLVAQQVVAEMGARLTPTEQRLIEHAAPSSPEAHDRYLHALALYAKVYTSKAEERLAEQLLTETIALDPTFALAYALRAKVRARIRTSIEPSLQLGVRVKQLGVSVKEDVERALALQPDLPEALAARAMYYTYIRLEPQRALADLERALALAPNDAQSQHIAGLTLRRLGRMDEALMHFEQAALLTPTQWQYLGEFISTLTRIGRYRQAAPAYEQALRHFPDDPWPRLLRHFNRFLATGETSGWREEHERLAAAASERFPFFLTWGMLTCLEDLPGQIAFYESITNAEDWGTSEGPAYLLGLAHTVTNRPEQARPYLDATLAEARSSPEDGHSVSQGAVALMLLGQADEALRLADEAVRLTPEARDAVNGTSIAMLRAWVLVRSGSRAEEGYSELRRLLGKIDQHPRWVAVQLPWMLMRNDARVQQILREAIVRDTVELPAIGTSTT